VSARSSRGRIGILISGRGSNMVAILDRIARGDLLASAAVVISDHRDAPGLEAARARGVPTLVIDRRGRPSRGEHERSVAEALAKHRVDLVCLAGYMRVLSPWFVRRFHGRILNIHPSLLPAFPGMGAQRQALDHGVKVSGCTVHFVDEGVDSGPIVLQATVPVLDHDTAAALAERILKKEHQTYSRAIALVLSGRLRTEGRRVVGTTARPRTPSGGGRRRGRRARRRR
jgi:phosphoribosylglycinamide formyltransferase 1